MNGSGKRTTRAHFPSVFRVDGEESDYREEGPATSKIKNCCRGRKSCRAVSSRYRGPNENFVPVGAIKQRP
jgi:hypothetical protein